MSIKYKNLAWNVGSVNLPGIKEKVYAVAKRDIVTWPTRPTTFTTSMGELASYVGNFVLAADTYFTEIGILVDKSPVDSKSQGTVPSKTVLNSATFVHPGVDAEAAGFIVQANNDDVVYIVVQKNGQRRIIGNDMYQTSTSFEQKLGGAPTDEMGTTMTATVTDTCLPLYKGTIVLSATVTIPALV